MIPISIFAQDDSNEQKDVTDTVIYDSVQSLHKIIQSSSLGSAILAIGGVGFSVMAMILAIFIYKRQSKQSEDIKKIIQEVHEINSEQHEQLKNKKESGELTLIGYFKNFIEALKKLIDEVKLLESGKADKTQFLKFLNDFENRRTLIIDYLDKQSILFADSLDSDTLTGIFDLDNNLKSFVAEFFAERPHSVTLKMTVLLLYSIARSLEDDQMKKQLEEKFPDEIKNN